MKNIISEWRFTSGERRYETKKVSKTIKNKKLIETDRLQFPVQYIVNARGNNKKFTWQPCIWQSY